ncbi:putative chitinase 3, partial [Stegodyphus mimosarum]
MQVTSFLFFVSLTVFWHEVSGKQKIVCYFINWAWYRSQPGNLLPEDVDPTLCTHINYAFAILDKNKLILKPSDEWADID